MNKASLIKKISGESGLSQKRTTEVIDNLLETITSTLENGEKVQLMGFGSFEVRDTKERMGVNPQKPTERLLIPASKKVYFRPSKTLKEIIRQGE